MIWEKYLPNPTVKIGKACSEQERKRDPTKTASLVLGVLVIIGMCVAFLPFLGWMNWGVIPVAGIGLIISIVATATAREEKGTAVAGIVLCGVAILVGAFRLIIGGGII